ncbi:uncharacterized protein LOC124356668 [Homalodisca vitripennis]|uniref:uncharacterized protein LOC124356668 n=1 Tax=Homalodisca vitripennis TaxID=197043 RepID=UPI001EEA6972|nr:uncharacterized protein LOC124356668 [Homalodisca vitripennis]
MNKINCTENQPSTNGDSTGCNKMEYCPECLRKNKRSPVQRYQLTNDIYLIFCTDENECTYHEEFRGKALVNKVDVTSYGFPEELWLHVDIYPGDLPKIVYLCLHEYVINKYFSNTSWNRSTEELKNMIRVLSSMHSDESVHNWTTLSLETPLVMLREKVEELVSDLTPQYREEIKNGFAKINNYTFPDDFIKIIQDKDSILYKSVKSFKKRMKKEQRCKLEDPEDLLL